MGRTTTEKNKGFTLIELLVAMGIFILLSAGFILRFSTTNADEKLHAAVTQMVGAIKEARHDSVTVLEYGQGTGIFPSYGIMFDMDDPTNVTLFADCVVDDTGNGVLDYNDDFTYQVTDTDCGGDNGFIKKIPLERGTAISAIRTVVGSTTVSENKAWVEFIRPLPLVWLTGETAGVLPYGKLSVDISSPGAGTVQTVEIYQSGLITPTLSNETE